MRDLTGGSVVVGRLVSDLERDQEPCPLLRLEDRDPRRDEVEGERRLRAAGVPGRVRSARGQDVVAVRRDRAGWIERHGRFRAGAGVPRGSVRLHGDGRRTEALAGCGVVDLNDRAGTVDDFEEDRVVVVAASASVTARLSVCAPSGSSRSARADSANTSSPPTRRRR